MSKLMLPQAGIVTSLEIDKCRAKVFLPLFKIESDWMPVAYHLELIVGDEVTVVFLNGDINDGRVVARF